jgi:purine-binding chemotaxis protein CheW
MVLDFTRLMSQEFNEIPRLARISHSDVSAESSLSLEEEDGDEMQLVSFVVAGQEYAVDIARVQEIVQAPERVVHAPNSAAHVVGLITLRERVLPLVSLRSLFNLPARAMDESSRIIVITVGSGAVGVVTDNVAEVLRVPKSIIDDVPGLLAKDGKLSDIGQICRLSGGTRLVSIIITEHLFQNAQLEHALEICETENQEAHADLFDEHSNDDEQQVVVFRLGDGEFGALIESVQEIVRVPDELTQVPKAPHFVEGVINLRGSVLPVIDQRTRLGLAAMERTDRQRIMVLLLDGVRTGFVVDAVTEVLKVSKSAITASPCSFGKPSGLLAQVVNLEQQKRLVQLIDFACLSEDDTPSMLIESLDHH